MKPFVKECEGGWNPTDKLWEGCHSYTGTKKTCPYCTGRKQTLTENGEALKEALEFLGVKMGDI